MHGGIGMTDEHDAGLYLKRAQAADMMLRQLSPSTASATRGFRASDPHSCICSAFSSLGAAAHP